MKPTDGTKLNRRSVLKGATLAGAAALATPLGANAQTAPAPTGPAAAPNRTVPLPNPAAETGTPPALEPLTQSTGGSDFMVDVIKSLGFEYLAANPGTSFRGLHESIINYGNNTAPEFITCTHEEASVAMAHGYYKIEGKPILVCAHGTVGLQHASMALYNAWCDRVPIYMMIGNSLDETKRAPGAVWAHSVQDAALMVREFIKWDDTPVSLQHFSESAVRAYKIAMTPPMEPVILVIDTELQENPIPPGVKPTIPKLPDTVPPMGDSGAVAELARLLVAAENPVILCDRSARTQAGIDRLVELAEALQVPVVDLASRMNFPTRHPLNQSNRGRAVIAQADLVVGLECLDFWGATNSFHDLIEAKTTPIARRSAKTVTLGVTDLYMKSNYQDFQRFADVDLAIAGDAEATMPSLTEAVRKLVGEDRKSAFQARGAKLATAHKAALEQARTEATWGWDASPVSTARMCAELWEQLRGEDWSLASTTANFVSAWPQRLWDMSKIYHNTGSSGGYGIGYCAPAATGSALANRKHGRITVSIQPDGDLMYSPGVLWTAAHHKIPILFVMHNNRAYHQEIMGIQRMANRHQRGIDRTHIGVTLWDPFIDYAAMARSMGVKAEGPISDPKDLGPALKRAIEVVKRGEPALVDVVTQPR